MEEQNATHLRRLLSDCSTVSSDSCEYYQTEIYDLLPSVQATRAEQSGSGVLESKEAGQSDQAERGELSHGQLLRGQRDKESMQPLRNLAMCIQAKRDARERRKMKLRDIGFWNSWLRTQSIKRKRSWEQLGQAVAWFLPWRHSLRVIEGRFGVGVKSYFVFFRYLIYLNLLHSVIISGFILGPTYFYGSYTKEELVFNKNDSVLTFLLGTGYLDRSPVFYGFYKRGSLNSFNLNTPLLYLAGIFTVFVLSLIMLVRRATVGYKHTWMLGKRYNTNVSFKIFCGWDFNIRDRDAADLKHHFVKNDLKLFLEEQRFSLRKAQRTLEQRVRLYLLRLVLNVLVLSLLCGALYIVYFATETSLKGVKDQDFLSLLYKYLPAITLTFVNIILPEIFSKISSYEDYSFTVQVNATLVRSIILKLGSHGIHLGIILFGNTSSTYKCIENLIGREMYKLCIFSFIITFCITFFWNYPRRLVQEKYPRSLLGQLSGKQQFLIHIHVLDLVTLQTVIWVGVYHCPLLPLIGIATMVATFYIKKFTVLRCCVAEQQFFQGSSVLFYFMLLFGLFSAFFTLGFHLYRSDLPTCKTSCCGPFGNGLTVFNVTGEFVKNLPPTAQPIIRYLTSEAFAVPLILAEIILLTSYVSRGRANQKAIERLKEMLIMSSSDKRFLVKQHATILRCRRNPRRVRPRATEGGDPLTHS